MHPVSLNCGTYVERMVKIGDEVHVGDPLIVFDANSGDPEVEEFLAALKGRKDIVDDLVESSQTTIKTDDSGIISDIRVYTTVPVESLSPTLQKIVKDYHKRIETKSNILEKYRNPGDNDFYKCGQLVTETTDVVTPEFGKIKGKQVGDGVYIEFYIKFKDIVKKGDKQTNYCALKGVTSHVMPEGQEPFSEFRPDEEISALVAPLGILARKTPSIYTNLFGNKVLIELKRKLMEDYMKN
jgi:DNA-directed RNA polymerase beta subunit